MGTLCGYPVPGTLTGTRYLQTAFYGDEDRGQDEITAVMPRVAIRAVRMTAAVTHIRPRRRGGRAEGRKDLSPYITGTGYRYPVLYRIEFLFPGRVPAPFSKCKPATKCKHV